MSEKEIDQTSGIETTGHEWDGIKELNNPLPRWWLWTFYATIVFSIGYMVWYPSIPLWNASTEGLSGETTRSLLQEELAAVRSARAETVEKLAATDLESIRADAELSRFATAGGASIFKVYCTQCHGSGAAGSPGYPNLNDDDWLWGGDLESIYLSIKHGIRNGVDDDARDSLMPSFGADELLDKEEINAVTEFVLQISDQEHDAALAGTGREIFADNCSSCHGADGKGDREFGAPNLADAIALYGTSRADLKAQLHQPKHGVMPPWGDKLGETGVKQLAIYVHGLGGGEKAKAE
ncbi:MAG: cytochrome-c oxidase, cbb3-type subunit III [Rhizobiaceae bacterium]|nr:cytochrome-c oxidase, cbb3-type subunit III [Hyphomicrobiales bacterium]NRB32372.1 cytochrome-c oxidase, cbb3-type subunit III [Rhizobiaceae bacterium]